jgi:raffinose/stachyose/melibiose transport system substrate-binding protein
MKKTMIGAMIAVLLATAAVPAVAETPARKVELKVFMSFPRFKDRIEKYLEVFKAREKAEKNIDVTVKLEMPNSDQALPILRVRMAANDAPDVFTLHAVGNVPEFYRGGYLTDLSNQPFVKKLHPSVRNTVTYDGKVVALPLESLSWGYMYNKKIFADLKLTPPQTLSEMRTVVAKLKAAKVTPFLLSFQESWIPQLMMALSLGGVASSSHPDFVDRMNRGVGSYKDVAEVFDIIDLILANGTDKPFETGSSNGSADFANGKAAMWVQGPWMSESILKANPDFQIGVAPLPVSDNPAATMINLSTSTSLAVSPTSKNKDVALDLINFFLDDKESSALFQDLQFNPVATIHSYPTMPWTKEAMEYVAKGRAYQDLSLPNAVTDETAKLLQSYYLKETTRKQIIDRLDKTWAKAIKTAK